jgi:hypothetical protein
MSIVNMNFVVALVNAELPKLLSIALQQVAAGTATEADERITLRLSAKRQKLQCALDQHRDCVQLVRDVLHERVLAMSRAKVGYTLAEVEAYRAAMPAELAREVKEP